MKGQQALEDKKMKTIKNLLLASSMIILSANAFASSSIAGDYSLHHSNKTIKTAAVDSKEAVYSLEFEKLEQLKSESGSELSHDLSAPVSSYIEVNSVP